MFLDPDIFGGAALVSRAPPDDLAAAAASPAARFLVVDAPRVLLSPAGGGLAWLTLAEAERAAGMSRAQLLGGGAAVGIEVFWLGSVGDGGAPRFALSGAAWARSPPGAFEPLRGVLRRGGLPAADAALAGLAAALANWHDAHRFCPRCGAAAAPAAGGARRLCTADAAHKLYPRTDPVAIVLVESADGGEALLVQPLALAGTGAFTCVSGFCEQGESAEAAAAREAREETGVRVQPGSVRALGTQAWPLGRGGSCELMVGCAARAARGGAPPAADPAEVAACGWFSRADVAAALQRSASPGSPYLGGAGAGKGGAGQLVYVPPPAAIAHHLLRAWLAAPPGGGAHHAAL